MRQVYVIRSNIFSFWFSEESDNIKTTQHHKIIQYNTAQYNTAQYDTVEYNTIHYDTIWNITE